MAGGGVRHSGAGHTTSRSAPAITPRRLMTEQFLADSFISPASVFKTKLAAIGSKGAVNSKLMRYLFGTVKLMPRQYADAEAGANFCRIG
jgi:hypothetical protein